MNFFLVYSMLLNASVVVPTKVISRDTTWRSDTVKLSTDIIIDEKATLFVDPGVVIEFQGSYGFTVYGALVAKGTIADSVKFLVKPGFENPGWKGIRFLGNQKLPGILSYCVFKYSRGNPGGAVYAENVFSLSINHSAFSTNNSSKGGAIYAQNSGLEISNCNIFNNNSENEGGGLFIINCSKASITNSIVTNNHSLKFGGGVYLESSKTLMKSNKLFNNSCTDDPKNLSGGGGIASLYGADTITNNLIFNNETNTSGGGLFYLSANGLSVNNHICNNKASDGGGISIINSSINIYNSIIYNNNSTATLIKSNNLYIYSIQKSLFSNCLVNTNSNYLVDTEKNTQFTNNINADPSFLVPLSEIGNNQLANAAIWLISDKSPAVDAGILNSLVSTMDYDGNNRVINGKVDIGAYEYQPELNFEGVFTSDIFWYGKINVTGDITIANNARLIIFPDTRINFTGPYGIAVQGQVLANGEPNKPIVFSRKVTKENKVTDTPEEGWRGLRFTGNTNGMLSQLNYCIFEYCNNNTKAGDEFGGAIYCNRNVQLSLKNTIIRYCTAPKGGAVYALYTSGLNIVNSLFYGNVANDGGMLYLNYSNSNILNCTAYNNGADNGGGIYCLNSNPVIQNSIFWKNSAKKGNQIYLADVNSDPAISYSDIDKGIDGIEGPGAAANYTGLYNSNIEKNPLFNNPDKANKFSLKTQSPCINSGDPKTTAISAGLYDLMGNNRIAQIIDMGAYENQPIIKVNSLADLSLVANSGSYTINLSEYFKISSVDDTLKFGLAAPSDTNTVSVKIEQSQLQILPKLNLTGIDTLIISIESTLGSAYADTFLVKVDYLKLTLESPFNNYHFKLNEDQVLKWLTVPGPMAAVKAYCIRIVEMHTGQTPEQAIKNNIPFYTDTIAQGIASTISTQVKIKFPVYGKMSWQVYAINKNGMNAGISPVQTFYGAPLLNMFYAGANIVNVDTTIRNDISDLEGKGYISVPGNGKISFDFKRLSLKMINNVFYLDNGAIALPYSESLTILPIYEPNGDVGLEIDTLYIEKTGFYIRGNVSWKIPIAGSAEFNMPRVRLSFDNFEPAGTILLDAIKFRIDALPEIIMEIDSKSVLNITDGLQYAPSLDGRIRVPINNPLEYLSDSIGFNFSGIGTIDYFQSNGLNSSKLSLNPLINIVPGHFNADFSNSVSTAGMEPEWKGIRVDQFKITFTDRGIDFPLALSASDGIYFNSTTNKKLTFKVSSNGLEIKTDTTFLLSIPSKFNGYNGSLKSVRLSRPITMDSPDMITGGAIVPFIDETFEHRYALNFNGLQYTPEMQPAVTDFSFYPYTEKLIDKMQIISDNQRFDGVIDQTTKTIRFQIPDNIDISSVPAYFIVRGNKVNLTNINQVRGETVNNFSSPVIYRVYAPNDTYFDYVITVSRIITAIDEPEISYSVFPNPSKDYLKISTTNYKGIKASLFNNMGRQILTKYLDREETVIPIQALPSGVYILYLQSGDAIQSLRIIKE